MMVKRPLFLIFLFLICYGLTAGTIVKTYYTGTWRPGAIGPYQTISFDQMILSGMPGEPLLPWNKVVLMLPPGEAAVSIEVKGEEETPIPGLWDLYPKQNPVPTSAIPGNRFIKNEQVYGQTNPYPSGPAGHLMTQYLDGYAFALCSYTPVRYIPSQKKVSYFRKITVTITTGPDANPAEALQHLVYMPDFVAQIRRFAQNPEMMQNYPAPKQPSVLYQYLIIAPTLFKNEFQSLITMYSGKGIIVHVVTVDSISALTSGYDLPEKMRNFIISEHTNHGIEYVLLAGNPPLVPCRGFYCYVQSGPGYEDSNIPGDLYFSGLDGNYDANGNHIYGELTDNADLLPDISVGRFPVNDTAGLHRILHKTISYQNNPVLGEFNKPLLLGEYLYNDPVTFGGPYMDLLVNDHTDNGYYSHGIPQATNSISKLYDTLISQPLNIWSWNVAQLLARINQGNSFIHHLGHANTVYMLRMNMSDITNANFYNVNGVDHNYQFVYTQGCEDGAFDDAGGCIAAKALTIDNFLAAGIFNSRYGWFDEGTTDGPSEHLEREFVSSIYTDTMPEYHLGTAHMISKINTAPWVSVPGEFEPGAQRWCHYCCNLLGDPALELRMADPTTFSQVNWTGAIDSDWNKPGNWSDNQVPTSLYDVVLTNTTNKPVINTVNISVCHDVIIRSGGKLTILPAKSMIIRGSVITQGNP